MNFKIIESERYFRYDIAGEARMLFTTRRGGVSPGRYASLNMGYSTDDSKEHIYKNRAIVLAEFGLGIGRMVSSDQVHGIKVVGVTDASYDYGECDGLFTRQRGVVLCMYFADCTPLYFYDDRNSAIGLSHAGWRGSCYNIARESVRFMQKEYGTDVKYLKAVIGPSIAECCFEVGSEVVEEFERELGFINVTDFIRKSGGAADKFLMDLKGINRRLLNACGILDENIYTHKICTSCERDTFYSYRRDARDTGRMAGLAFLV